MSRKTRIAWLAVPLFLALLDLWTKAQAGPYPCEGEAPPPGKVVIQDWLEIRTAWNEGALFGFDWIPPWALVLLTGLAVPLVAWWVFHPKTADAKENFGKLLVLGGALGNLYDRLCFGKVRDFINFYYGSMEPGPGGQPAAHWPTFNIADSALVAGVILLLLSSFLQGPVTAGGKAA